MMHLQTRGVKIPEEMAVVSFGGLPITSYLPFSLSAVDVRMDVMCSHAVNLVLQMVKGDQLAGTRVMVQPQFIERKTT
jgi:DNA-binding LacI/PurR family transcriptional regulator